MKIICFRGDADCGKSKTIEESLNNVFNLNLIKPKIQKEAVIILKHRNEVIGICSIGDNFSSMKNHLETIKSNKCDKVIIAIRNDIRLINKVRLLLNVENMEFIDCPDVGDNEQAQKTEVNRRIGILRSFINSV